MVNHNNMHQFILFSTLTTLFLVVTGCQTAPAEADICPTPACSGHGTCTAPELRPVCACDDGYTGAVCSMCDEGYVRADDDTCVVAGNVECADDSCPANATCAPGALDVECTCIPPFVGVDCDTCGPGWHDDGAGGCALDRECQDHSCSGRGSCSVADNVVTCDCDDGFAGAFCDDIVDGCSADTCGDNGRCEGATGVARCECLPGYAGALCDMCAEHFVVDDDGSCSFVPACDASACHSRGTCTVVDGAPLCDCDDGYAGDSCGACAEGHHLASNGACAVDEACDADSCTDGGACDDTTGAVRCVCDDTHAGERCEQCYPGFHDDGDGNCVVDEVCDAFSCNGGTCDASSGVVVCDACPAGFSGDFCELNVDDCVHHACDNGVCIDLVDDRICLCNDGTYGEECP